MKSRTLKTAATLNYGHSFSVVRRNTSNQRSKQLVVVLALLLFATQAVYGQKTTPVSGSGTTGNIPVFTGTSTIGNSFLQQSARNLLTGSPFLTTNVIRPSALTFLNGANFVMQASPDGNASFAGLLAGNGSRLTGVNAAMLGGYQPNAFVLQNGGASLANLFVGGAAQIAFLSGTGLSFASVSAQHFSGDGTSVSNVNAALLQGHPASDFVLSSSGGGSNAPVTWTGSLTTSKILPPVGNAQTSQWINVFTPPVGITVIRMEDNDPSNSYIYNSDPITGPTPGGPCGGAPAKYTLQQGPGGTDASVSLTSNNGSGAGGTQIRLGAQDSGPISVPMIGGSRVELVYTAGWDSQNTCRSDMYGLDRDSNLTTFPLNFTIQYTIP